LLILGLLIALGGLVLVIAAGRQPTTASITTIEPPAAPATAAKEH
jgi:hypothetical protein